MFAGPNATVGHGRYVKSTRHLPHQEPKLILTASSLIYSLDWSAEYITQWLRKMSSDDISSVEPKQQVVDEFVRYGDEIMKTFTWTGNCTYYTYHFYRLRIDRRRRVRVRNADVVRSIMVQKQPYRWPRHSYVRGKCNAIS